MKPGAYGFMPAAALLLAAPFAAADDNDTLAAAIAAGSASVDIRVRYEHVDRDSIPDAADALTGLLRLNYSTGLWRGWSGFAEFDHVFHLLNDFNSGAGTSPGNDALPVVADPEGADLNQLYLDYRINDAAKLRVGRQRILLDNQRFVGGVGWRQNEQTYDGLTVTSSAIPKTTLKYSYVGYVRRIFGQTVAAGKNNVDTHLLNAIIALTDEWLLTPYVYYIDNQDVAAFSTSTLGARLAGGFDIGENDRVKLAVEVATQSDVANNPVGYDARYVLVDASWSIENGPTLGLAFESLGGSATRPGAAFRTPLATLHAFQGWADKFLATPDQGIDDLYATIKVKAGRWNLTGVYHDFSAEAGAGDLGTEFDVSAGTKLNDNYGIEFKGAFFSGDSPSFDDTNVFWITFTADY